MSEAFVGEIRLFSFPFAPRNWAQCNGQQMNLQQNIALYSLIGTVYGGDGKTNFNLPDLRGRVPVHRSVPTMPIGAATGTETVTLTSANLPAHSHTVYAKAVNGDKTGSKGNYFAQPTPNTGQAVPAPMTMTYGSTTLSSDLQVLASDMFDVQGGGQAHDNTQPSIALNFCISLIGNFPSRY